MTLLLQLDPLSSLTSVEGILSHLDDPSNEIVQNALQSLLELIDFHWSEIGDKLTEIEELSEDTQFPYRTIASLLASKIFYHLQSYEDSLNHALSADTQFNIAERSQYVRKLTEQCIDSYRQYQQRKYNLEKEQKTLEDEEDENDDDDSDDDDDDDDADDDEADNNNNSKAKNEMKIDTETEVELENIDDRLITIVERVLNHCYETGDFIHAMGIAIECRRLDHVQQCIAKADNVVAMLEHCFKLCETVIHSRTFRDELLSLILTLFDDESLVAPEKRNYHIICRCFFYLRQTKPIADILWHLINGGAAATNKSSSSQHNKSNNNNNNNNADAIEVDDTEENNNNNNDSNKTDTNTVLQDLNELTAYQIAFDLTEYQNDTFTRNICDSVPQPPPSQLNPKKASAAAAATAASAATPTTTATTTATAAAAATPAAATDATNTAATTAATTVATTANTDAAADTAAAKVPEIVSDDADTILDWWSEGLLKKWKQLKSILLGSKMIPLCLDFLFRNCASDLLILKKMKDGISERNSVLNNALICANALMHAGTTYDQFLRDNIEWMSRAAHWAKFSAVASLGVIHHHHISKSMDILQRYLPGSGGGPYQEGGSLYALGLIHVGDNSDTTCVQIREFLLQNITSATNEILQHGACLGLGLAALSSQSEPTLAAVRNILFQDRAVPGEAAGIAIGLILCGSGNKRWYDEMLAYAHETQHSKIVRGLCMGIAVMYYNLEEKAEYVIAELLADPDEILRYGACYTIGMAYAATANNSAISKLLHLAVSDVSNDVRRAAVTNIGFVLCNKPHMVPKVVQLLCKSYNSHVRYGAAAAIGIACAGSGNLHALKLLKKLATDNVDYVRQASLIALGMLTMEHNKTETAAVSEIRDVFFLGSVTDKRESTMSKMGAILGSAIIDGSGRNVTIELYNAHNKCKRQTAIIGMAVFWQYWYWYPLIPFLTLCFKPTMIMCLNRDLDMVDITVQSNVSPAKFVYVEKLKESQKAKKKKVTKAVLSITMKQKARELKRQKSLAEADESSESAATKAEASTGDGDDQAMTETETVANVGESDAVSVPVPVPTKAKADAMEVDADGNANADGDGDGDVVTAAVKADASADAGVSAGVSEEEKKEKEKEKEKKDASFEYLSNPSRVTPNQCKYIVWSDKRYRPMTGKLNGFVVVADTTPEEAIKLVDLKTTDAGGVYGNEPEPPKPFLYLGN